MRDFLIALEASALGDWLRGLGVWTYGLLNLGHIAGISALFGSVLLLDLRLLGFWRPSPLAAISRPTVPVSIVGFCVAAIAGVSMLTFNASEYYGNPFLLLKFAAIGLALVNVAVTTRIPAWRDHRRRELSATERRQLAAAGGLSLVLWGSALAAGRMIGYW